MDPAAWVGAAALGAAGALARYAVDGAVSARLPGPFPHGTLAVNLSGSLALGLLVGLGTGATPIFLLGVGLLGSYTTFSTWMLEAQRLGEDGEWTLMWLSLATPMLAGLAAAGLGWALGGALA